jgi:hypothetical protein
LANVRAGLRSSLVTKNKRTSHGRPLPLPIPEKSIGEAVFFSPQSVRQAKAKLKQQEQEKHQEELQKAETKKFKADTKLLKRSLLRRLLRR